MHTLSLSPQHQEYVAEGSVGCWSCAVQVLEVCQDIGQAKRHAHNASKQQRAEALSEAYRAKTPGRLRSPPRGRMHRNGGLWLPL